ncbi:MAG: DNA translocase FtsK 4TM domain-containing protein, partial [Clostridia bacterium]|nr:DNA translocase FtsK 4TM domain-containing protein [Clostridia bacterium]
MAPTKAKKKPAPKAAARPAVKVVRDASIGRGAYAKRQAAAVVLFFVALLLASVVLIPGHNVWKSLHSLFFGLFGVGAFLWPPVLIYIALISALERPFKSIAAKLWEAAGLIVLICSAIHIFTVGGIAFSGKMGFAKVYSLGTTLKCGGVAGGLTGGPLFLLFGKAGAAITVILLAIVLFVLVTGLTLLQILSLFIPSLRKAGNAKAKKAAAVTPEPVFFKHKKPAFFELIVFLR